MTQPEQPARAPDQIVSEIAAEREGLTAAFDALAAELGQSVQKTLAFPPIAAGAGAARIGAHWAAALRHRLSRRP